MDVLLLIIGSFIPWIYYGFYCRMEPKLTYIAVVFVLGAAAIIVSLWDRLNGVRSLFENNAFHWLLLMAFLYLLGALLYATRTSERFFTGKCDIWFQSHQLFDTCVVDAAFMHYYGISEMAWMRLNARCPADVPFEKRDGL